MAAYKVLCIDGGGIRGVVPAVWLREIESQLIEEEGETLSKHVNLVCGTSTGAIVSAAIAVGMPMNDLVAIFRKRGAEIFRRGAWPSISIYGKMLFLPKYDGKMLYSILYEILGDNKLKDAKCNICMTAYDVHLRKILLMRSYDKFTCDILLRDACMASASAPTYFPPFKLDQAFRQGGEDIEMTRYLVDGGIYANNPSSLGVAEAIAINRKGSIFDLDSDLHMISMGTGNVVNTLCRTKNVIPPKSSSSWLNILRGPPLIDAMFDSTSVFSEHVCQQILLDENYLRLQIQIDDSIADERLDNVHPENIKTLVGISRDYITDNREEKLRAAIRILKKSSNQPVKDRARIMSQPE